MKLKELILNDDEQHLSIHKNYNDFVDNNVPHNSIEIDATGKILSNKTSILNYINFLLTQVKYASEGKNNEFEKGGKKTKKKSGKKKLKDVPYDKLSLKHKRERNEKNTGQFANGHSEYPDEYSARISESRNSSES